MRKIIGRISLLLIIVCLLIPAFPKIFAQEANLLLSVTPYETREDIDILFEESTRVLDYLEGEDVEKPIFLSLISETQRQILIGNGFDPKIIDSNVDITRYTLLYHPKPNQSAKLSSYGTVYPISSHYTFLKSPPGVSFSHEGVAAEFFDVPFPERIVTPPLRTKTLLLQSPIPQSPTITPPSEKIKPDLFKMIAALAIPAVIIFGLTLFKKFRTRDRLPDKNV